MPQPARAVRAAFRPGRDCPRRSRPSASSRGRCRSSSGCRRRYGDTFTRPGPAGGPMVFISDPTVAQAPVRRRPAEHDRSRPQRHPRAGPRRPVAAAPGGRRAPAPAQADAAAVPRRADARLRDGDGARRPSARSRRGPSAREFRLHPSMQAITLEVILRAVFGVEDGQRRNALRTNLVGILADDPLAAGDRLDASTGCAACPATAASREMLAAGRPDPVRRDRRAPRRPESRVARGHPLDARRGPLRGRLRDVRLPSFATS